jgi:uncharacterized integral membrane protein (TIGR00698 family)
VTPDRLRELAPGVLACVVVAAASVLAADGLTGALGRTVLEPIVLALLLGIALRLVPNRPLLAPGAAFSAKPILEAGVAVVGASIDLGKLAGSGIVIAAIVLLGVGGGLALSLLIGHRLGLSPRLALLVAAGNSICGNSAIAAVGSVVGATRAEIASAIGLTAIAGLVMVLGLPVVAAVAGIDQVRYGVLTGMTVYAIPQVAAAAFPVGPIATETAMLVKLTRVVLLAPITITTALLWPRIQPAAGETPKGRPSIRKLVPWFVLVFLVLAGARSLGLIPAGVGDTAKTVGSALLTIGMVGVGFAVDPQAIRAVGLRVGLATVLSLVVMIVLAVTLIVALGVPPANG